MTELKKKTIYGFARGDFKVIDIINGIVYGHCFKCNSVATPRLEELSVIELMRWYNNLHSEVFLQFHKD